jgi:hypothetical protein
MGDGHEGPLPAPFAFCQKAAAGRAGAARARRAGREFYFEAATLLLSRAVKRLRKKAVQLKNGEKR